MRDQDFMCQARVQVVCNGCKETRGWWMEKDTQDERLEADEAVIMNCN